ncbi:MAG: YggT family protein [Thermodesulfobacteriota bacterium]
MNFFGYLIKFIYMILNIYMWIVIASAVITWVSPDPMNPIVRALRGLTEPVYGRIRRFVPTSFGGLDLAPMILILVILFIQQVVFPTLLGWLNS